MPTQFDVTAPNATIVVSPDGTVVVTEGAGVQTERTYKSGLLVKEVMLTGSPPSPSESLQKGTTMTTLDQLKAAQLEPAFYNAAEDHALHDRFLREVASGSVMPQGSPIYENLHNAYLRHEMRQNGSGTLAKAMPPIASDARPSGPPNGGAPYPLDTAMDLHADDQTQEAAMALIAAVYNAIRNATNADENASAMAKARGATRYSLEPHFKAIVDAFDQRKWQPVWRGLDDLAKGRDANGRDVDDVLGGLATRLKSTHASLLRGLLAH